MLFQQKKVRSLIHEKAYSNQFASGGKRETEVFFCFGL